MPEVPLAGKEHRDTVFIARRNDILVFLGSTRLDYRHDSGLGSSMDRVGEREKSIRSKYASSRTIGGLGNRDLDAVDATHLASTNADQ